MLGLVGKVSPGWIANGPTQHRIREDLFTWPARGQGQDSGTLWQHWARPWRIGTGKGHPIIQVRSGFHNRCVICQKKTIAAHPCKLKNIHFLNVPPVLCFQLCYRVWKTGWPPGYPSGTIRNFLKRPRKRIFTMMICDLHLGKWLNQW